MNILITGGAGFIGSNFVNHMVCKYPDYLIVNIDKLTYAGTKKNLKQSLDKQIFIKGDICNKKLIANIFKKYAIDHIINFAAETHVDNSIKSSDAFFKSNLLGTKNLLDLSLDYGKIKKFYQISTDEVYGSLKIGTKEQFYETTPLSPKNPYSASKAAADLLIQSYINTYKIPAIISRCGNNYGPNQFPEKFIALAITNLLKNKKIPIYGNGDNIRDWIYVQDHVEAIDLILHKGKINEIYNIGGFSELSNLNLAKIILKLLSKNETNMEFVKDRPGHDKRYSSNYAKIKRELGWEPRINIEEGLKKTIEFFKLNLKK